MGINVGVEMPETTDSWRVDHANSDGAAWMTDLPDYGRALAALVEHDATCPAQDCAGYGGDLRPVYPAAFASAPEVSLSSRNAGLLAELLGLGDIWDVPALDPDDLVGRVLLARALAPVDAGAVTATTGNWVECGRAPGYTERALDRIADVAVAAKALGSRVVWG